MSKKTSNVISISKGADLYFAKANKYYLKNDIDKALEYYKRAMVIEPDNSINYFNVASLLGEIGEFHESNKIFRQTLKMNPEFAECWFYMGINYGQLQKYQKSKMCLEKYLQLCPEGEHSQQARDILGAFKSADFTLDFIDKRDLQKIEELCSKGIELVERGEYDKGEKLFEEAKKINSKVTAPINNLALTYYYQGSLQKAIAESKLALSIDPTNIYSLCNIIAFYKEANDEVNLRAMVKQLATIDIENLNTEELIKLAVTYGNLGKDSIAASYLHLILQEEPYNFKALYYGAIADFNRKKFKLSKGKWIRLKEIEPGNPFTSYYTNLIDKIIAKEKEFSRLSYQIKVPYNSLLEIVKILSSSDLKEEVNQYREDYSLLDSMIWVLNKGDNCLKEPLINLMLSLKDGKYLAAVVDFCYDIQQNYHLRNYAFQKILNLTYSFSSCEFWRKDIYENQREWTEPQRLVLQKAIKQIEVKNELVFIYSVQAIWNDYILKEKPIIRNIDTWVKALVALVVSEVGCIKGDQEIIQNINLKERSIKEKMLKIKKILYEI
ncbi:tetratricopeptide repeat protein [Anaerobranca gottschalkii]|uniref:Tetratricopeptide repeat-containing protein n=1 Tax=Anaerobranca gottschalkii DSM 13577 TaxID=1120990 RepID=A0A1H9Y8T0_9FIRM|nr:tetratricopeptide repeat protein [Anaerobranca gottschalkii]SES65228.1 Tetratricopeptide repeat-containing protein [Anaerobranca gottschalkii DSM 13577]